MAELIVTLKDRELKRVPLTRTDTAIGRDPRAEVQIDNVGISRVHAIVRFRDGGYRVHDHESSNGLSVNGEKCSVHALADGDIIEVGKFSVKFSASTGPEAPVEDNSDRSDLDDVKERSLADRTTALTEAERKKLSLAKGKAPPVASVAVEPAAVREEVVVAEPAGKSRERLLATLLVLAMVIIAVLAIALARRG